MVKREMKAANRGKGKQLQEEQDQRPDDEEDDEDEDPNDLYDMDYWYPDPDRRDDDFGPGSPGYRVGDGALVV
jgi:hypothetical protein